MARVLILFAHPGQRHSRINVRMAEKARQLDGVTFVDLYADYPRFNIDIEAEQQRLVDHEVIIFQFPIYWYSVPALLKEWQDLVLEYGFAYGQSGSKLKGKLFLPIVTTGGALDAYREEGSNHFRLRTLLSPLEQTASLCGMRFLPPMALFSAHDSAVDGRADRHIDAYVRLLGALRDETLDLDAVSGRELLGDGDIPLNGMPRNPLSDAMPTPHSHSTGPSPSPGRISE